MELSDGEKLGLIERYYERRRAQSDGESHVSIKKEARNKCGISRTTAYKLEKGDSLQDPKSKEHFESVFRATIAAEPGSPEHRLEWAKIQSIVGGQDKSAKLHLVGSAVGPWADLALDESNSDADRILVGRPVQFILHPKNCGEKGSSLLDIDRKRTFDRGASVNAVVVKLLTRNSTAPDGLFDHGSPEARQFGYKMLRIRLLADQLGWQKPATDEGRCALFERAFHAGLASDLMAIDDELGHTDISYSYRAFVLATHASEWERAGEYGLKMLKAFPSILTNKINRITAMIDDPEVWPGIAALIALRRSDLPLGVHNT